MKRSIFFLSVFLLFGLTAHAQFSVTATVDNNVSCFNGFDGAATANPSGGSAPYIYVWSAGGVTTQTVTGLSAGPYCVTATDFFGATATACVTITEPTLLTSNTAVTSNYNGEDISAFGACDGEATVTSSGGVAPYTYRWDVAAGGQITQVATGLCAGSYCVTTTDANGCTDSDCVIVTEPTVFNALISSQTNVSCNGGNDGSATVTGTGGVPPYTYQWDANAGNQTTPTATGLAAGIYCVTATDANAAAITTCVTITEPTAITVTVVSTTDVLCFGDSTGTATVSASGGTPGYSFLWDPSAGAQTTATATGLATGTYCVTATDFNGCTAVTCVSISGPASAVSVNATVTSNYNGADISTNGACDGEGTAVASGGMAPYTYLWSSNGNTTAISAGLCDGSSCVTATDANGCQATACITLTEPSALSLTASNNASPVCYGADQGELTVTASGGVPGYAYQWDANANHQTTATATGLSAGTTYSVTVYDANLASQTMNFNTSNSITKISVNGLCFGDTITSAIVDVPGPVLPSYTYQWDANAGSQTTATATGLTAGSYCVVVSDGACQDTVCTVINQPTTPLSVSFTTQDPSNCQTADGAITATASGGVPGYTYMWLSGHFGQTVAGMSAGHHGVIVTDTNYCSITEYVYLAPNHTSGIDTNYLVAPDSSLNFCVPYAATASGASYFYNPLHGNLTNNGSGCFTYNVTSSAEETDTIIIYVCDSVASYEHQVVVNIASCVWAGDTDTSQLVNNFDLLPIGQYYGTVGMPRPNADLNYDCEPMYDWSIVPLYTVDPKHSDCNGDGTVNDDDTLAITQNWGQLYVKSGKTSKNGVQIYVDTATTAPGDTVTLGVVLGNNVLPANNVYGVAFTINYDPGVIKSNSVKMLYNNTWLGTDGVNMLTIEKDFYNLGEVEVGMVRTDQQLVSGSGPICELQLTIKDDVLRKSRRLDLDITDVKLIDLAGNVIQTNPQPSSVLIDNPTGIAQTTSQEFEVQVFPNPSKGVVNVRLSEAQPTQLELYTATGQLLQSKQINSNTHQLDLSDLPKGVYMLSVQTEKGRVVKQIVRL